MNTVLEKSTQKPFIISCVFDASPGKVFSAWTESEHMEWWGPAGVTIAHHQMDLRPGGRFHYCMQTADGNKMWGKWAILEVEKPRRLVFISSFSDEAGGTTPHPLNGSWPLEMHSTITFTPQDGKTLVTIEWIPVNASEEECRTFAEGFDSMRQGWTGCLDKLTEYLTKIQN